MYSLETFVQVLTANNGKLTSSAKDLGMHLHALRHKIAEHAELQAIVANRDIEIADRSRDIILEVLQDQELSNIVRSATAKWALENLASDVYNRKQTLAVESRPIEELTPQELEARKTALAAKMASPRPEMTFNSATLLFADANDPEGSPRAGGDPLTRTCE